MRRDSAHTLVSETPAFKYSTARIGEQLKMISRALGSNSAAVLYSCKACCFPPVMRLIGEKCGGYSVSSRFELQLVSEQCIPECHIHYVAPVLARIERDDRESCNAITLNSLSQWRLHALQSRSITYGLRVNPALSIADDARYDPCREHSRLGVPLDKTWQAWRDGDLSGISGIHFHTACECQSWEPLLRTVRVIEKQLAPMMQELDWINLGGGYQWDETTDFGPLQEAVELLTNRYSLEVFLEPGDGIVNSAGSLIASVVDLFESDRKMVAILDTTVNHLPDVFEYQYEPDVAGHVEGAPHEYILAGCSCLAGDIFGEYAFEQPLDIGSRITFENVGAYSLVKANMFNGINLPSIYIQREDGELELVREFTYEDFLARCGGEAHAVARAGV